MATLWAAKNPNRLKASTEAGHVFRCPPDDAFDPWLPTRYPANTSQTISCLILIVAWGTCSPVGPAVHWLICVHFCKWSFTYGQI